jgi:hypothetical protein
MKPTDKKRMEKFEHAAELGADELISFFTYKGTDPNRLNRAKLGASAIGGYSRVRAAESNRLATAVAAAKLPTVLRELVKDQLE